MKKKIKKPVTVRKSKTAAASRPGAYTGYSNHPARQDMTGQEPAVKQEMSGEKVESQPLSEVQDER